MRRHLIPFLVRNTLVQSKPWYCGRLWLSVLAQNVRTLQAPLKEKYARDPASAVKTMTAKGSICKETMSVTIIQGAGQSVVDANGKKVTISGLHPAAGGDGTEACSGDMLLQSLVACAGVTFRAVWNAFKLGPITKGNIVATGEMDFKGTLGVDRDTSVGLTKVELAFDIVSDEEPAMVEKVVATSERFCVIYQTLKAGVPQLGSTTTTSTKKE